LEVGRAVEEAEEGMAVMVGAEYEGGSE